MTILQLNNLSIGYKDKIVADNITAALREGSLTCLVGRNGCGKSTLMRTVAAFQQPLGGSAGMSCDGGMRNVRELTPVERARMISVVLTERADLQNMTVREVVAMGRSPYTGYWGRLSSEDEKVVEESMRYMGIETMAERMAQTLSDGERQKMMIAKALAQQTPLILLDEPTAFLDYPSKVETMVMLHRLCCEQKKAVLISTHDLDVALRHCDGVWLMEDGSLRECLPNELKIEN